MKHCPLVIRENGKIYECISRDDHYIHHLVEIRLFFEGKFDEQPKG